jgi:deoxyribodipyrimidine photo-lyase
VVKDDTSPYVVYTPYANKWKENFKRIALTQYDSEAYLNKIALQLAKVENICHW